MFIGPQVNFCVLEFLSYSCKSLVVAGKASGQNSFRVSVVFHNVTGPAFPVVVFLLLLCGPAKLRCSVL